MRMPASNPLAIVGPSRPQEIGCPTIRRHCWMESSGQSPIPAITEEKGQKRRLLSESRSRRGCESTIHYLHSREPAMLRGVVKQRPIPTGCWKATTMTRSSVMLLPLLLLLYGQRRIPAWVQSTGMYAMEATWFVGIFWPVGSMMCVRVCACCHRLDANTISNMVIVMML